MEKNPIFFVLMCLFIASASFNIMFYKKSLYFLYETTDNTGMFSVETVRSMTAVDSTETSPLNQANLPNSETIPHLNKMQQSEDLSSSYKQQLKFFTMKDKLLAWGQSIAASSTNITSQTEEESSRIELFRYLLRPLSPGSCFSFILNDKYAYRHIFKSGGTTVAYQAGHKTHQSRDEIGDRKLITAVRDPIQHFLSGWAECGARLQLQNTSLYGTLADYSYDVRVQNYLMSAVECSRGRKERSRRLTLAEKKFCSCSKHVLPQFTYLLYRNERNNEIQIDPKLDIIGEMNEMSKLVKLAGFSFDRAVKTGRNAESNVIKTTYFPKRIDLLSNKTLEGLCRFLVMDYIAFDYDPPSACFNQLESDFIDVLSCDNCSGTKVNQDSQKISFARRVLNFFLSK